MTFVCLGWGSLTWDKERASELPTRGDWRADGPALPIEFARKSSDGRLTLVITPGAKRIPVLWSELNVDCIATAITCLARREGPRDGKPTPEKNIGRSPSGDNYQEAAEIARWQSDRSLSGVVWTALKPNFPNRPGCVPLLRDVLAHLKSLSGPAVRTAETYIRKTPLQINTAFRAAIAEVTVK